MKKLSTHSNYMDRQFPIDEIREQFPALQMKHNGQNIVFLDGPSGTQVPTKVVEAMANYLLYNNSNLGGVYPTSLHSERTISEGREAIANFVNCNPNEVAFGPNTTTLIFQISRAMSKSWNKGDNIVVTELDHRANVDPWLLAAKDRGLDINWIKLDIQNYVLDYSDLDEVITERTRIVAIGHASNGVGTINDLIPVITRARQVGALVIVDAVHSTPHIPIDFKKMDADILLASSYKFFGPHLGFSIIKEDVFKEIDTYRLQPAPQTHPGKLETGTQLHENIAGTTAAIDFIASIGRGNSKREKLVNAFDKIEQHEKRLIHRIRSEFSKKDKIVLYQAGDKIPKTPTVAFRVKDLSPRSVAEYLSDNHAIFVGDGHFYAQTISELLGLNDSGGWLRVGLAPYTSGEEIDRFLHAIKELLIAQERNLLSHH